MVTEPATPQVTAGNETGYVDITRLEEVASTPARTPKAAAEAQKSLPGVTDPSVLPSTLTGFRLLATSRPIQRRKCRPQIPCRFPVAVCTASS